MTEMNASATVGMSATVGETSATVGKMSVTVGEVSATVGEMSAMWGKCLEQWGIEYGLGNLRVEYVIHNFDRLPIRVHGIPCKNPIKI